MFYYSITNSFEKIIIIYQLLFKFLFVCINKLNIPFNSNFPLQFFNRNLESIKFLANHSESREKFFDLYMDYSELYYLNFNENWEILILLNLFFKTPNFYRFITLLGCFYFYLYFWIKNLIFWVYSISLPFVFFLIILYLDYLDGHFD